MQPSSFRPSRGFTIVETLVAIAVLMIAIAGPLVIANNGLVAAQNAKNQMTASFLAQESMMVIKNIKDSNISVLGANSWLDGLVACSSNSTSGCDASAIDSPRISSCPSTPNPVGGCPLYMIDTGYSHTYNPLRPVQFFRYVTLKGVSCVNGSPGAECTLSVTVTWYEGSVPENVTLNSEITKSIR